MSAPDPLAKLKALTQTQSGEHAFTHENEDEILQKLLSVFVRVPTGKDLVDKSKEYNVAIKLLKGKNGFSYAPESNSLFLGLPAGQTAPKSRMLLYLAMGLEEARQEFEGLKRPEVGMNREAALKINMEKQQDILFAMCKLAYECQHTLGLREIVDEIEKIGHSEVYRGFEQDVAEGQTKV